MKAILLLLSLAISIGATAQSPSTAGKPDSTRSFQLVDAACGECQFGLKGNSCDLAIRVDGKSWFVDGAHIDGFGDAHAKQGFCKAVRKAEVQGQVRDGRFKATYFRLLPVNQQ